LEVAGVGPQTLYRKIEFFEQQCLAFAAAHESRLSAMHPCLSQRRCIPLLRAYLELPRPTLRPPAWKWLLDCRASAMR
jgi:hypothetical protein